MYVHVLLLYCVICAFDIWSDLKWEVGWNQKKIILTCRFFFLLLHKTINPSGRVTWYSKESECVRFYFITFFSLTALVDSICFFYFFTLLRLLSVRFTPSSRTNAFRHLQQEVLEMSHQLINWISFSKASFYLTLGG